MAEGAECNEARREQMRQHGVFHMLQVEAILNQAGIICCFMGGKALGYYGAHRVPASWQVCVPDDRFAEAVQLFRDLTRQYEAAPKIMPQLASLLHTWPRFKPLEDNEGADDVATTFYIMPAFEWFPAGLNESMIERSRSNLPFPKLEQFAQSLVSTQRWPELVHLIDGMDLDDDGTRQPAVVSAFC